MHNKNGIYVKSQGWAQNRLTYVETLSQIGTNLSIWSISEQSDLRLWLKVGNFMELLQALSNDIEWFLKSLLWMIQSTEQYLADTNSETNQNHSQKIIEKWEKFKQSMAKYGRATWKGQTIYWHWMMAENLQQVAIHQIGQCEDRSTKFRWAHWLRRKGVLVHFQQNHVLLAPPATHPSPRSSGQQMRRPPRRRTNKYSTPRNDNAWPSNHSQ